MVCISLHHIEGSVSEAIRFQVKLALLVHVTAGQPARTTELLSMRRQNTSNANRNIFVEDRMMGFVSQYHKGFYASNDVKIVHRYVPREVGELVVCGICSSTNGVFGSRRRELHILD